MCLRVIDVGNVDVDSMDDCNHRTPSVVVDVGQLGNIDKDGADGTAGMSVCQMEGLMQR